MTMAAKRFCSLKIGLENSINTSHQRTENGKEFPLSFFLHNILDLEYALSAIILYYIKQIIFEEISNGRKTSVLL